MLGRLGTFTVQKCIPWSLHFCLRYLMCQAQRSRTCLCHQYTLLYQTQFLESHVLHKSLSLFKIPILARELSLSEHTTLNPS